MVLKHMIATWVAQKISEHPFIFASRIMDANRTTFLEMGLTEKEIYAISKQLKTQFHYWNKYEMSCHMPVEENVDILISKEDRRFIKSLIGPEVLRIPLNTINIEEDGTFSMYKRKEKCELLAMEVYRYGDFGPTLVKYDEKSDMNDLISYYLGNEDVHAWGYIKFLHDKKPRKEKAEKRAY